MPYKPRLVTRNYIIRWVSEHFDLPLSDPRVRRTVQLIVKRQGFPRDFYSPKEREELALFIHIWDKHLVDAFLERAEIRLSNSTYRRAPQQPTT